MQRALAGALMLVGALVCAGLVLDAVGAAPRSAEPLPTAIVVRSELPAWLAPGAPLRLHGFATPGRIVTLLVDGKPATRTRSGRFGRFRLRARAPAPGRHAVAVAAPGRREPVGILAVRPLRLAAVGDVKFDGSDPWTGADEVLRAADIATANLETAVSLGGSPVADKEYTFRGSPRALHSMASTAGVDVVSLANNHALDYGREAFLDTIRHARAAGLATVGGGGNLAGARRPALVEAGGLRIAFLGYSDVNPYGFLASESAPGTAQAVEEWIAADVRRARRAADLVVVWFHWGIELHAEPIESQERFAAAALNAGAKVVLGAHPHVLGPVSTPRARSLVAWSLGNFVFPSFREETVRTGILLVRLDARGVRGHDLLPYRIEGFRPLPLNET